MVGHEERRAARILQVYNTLKKSKNPDMDRLIYMGCDEWKCTRRTMLDYIKQAQLKIKYG